MVLNSSVKRNVSTKNREEVGDRERGEGRIFAYATGAGAKRGGGLRGRGKGEKCDSPLTFSRPPNPLPSSTPKRA